LFFPKRRSEDRNREERCSSGLNEPADRRRSGSCQSPFRFRCPHPPHFSCFEPTGNLRVVPASHGFVNRDSAGWRAFAPPLYGVIRPSLTTRPRRPQFDFILVYSNKVYARYIYLAVYTWNVHSNVLYEEYTWSIHTY
jgi:hypothetical protein